MTFVDLGDDRRRGLREFVDHLSRLAALGIDHAIVGPRDPWDEETLRAVCSVIPEVHAIPTRAAA